METITKDMTIGVVLQTKPAAAEALLGMGMHCLGCPSAQGETLEQAAGVHGVEVDDLVDKINKL